MKPRKPTPKPSRQAPAAASPLRIEKLTPAQERRMRRAIAEEDAAMEDTKAQLRGD